MYPPKTNPFFKLILIYFSDGFVQHGKHTDRFRRINIISCKPILHFTRVQSRVHGISGMWPRDEFHVN